MAKGPQRIRGTQDIWGEEADRFHKVVETFDRVRRLYAFQRVEIPVFEATEVFARSMGETTDVVSKQMYTFEDKGGDSVTLRPEFTAGLCRAYLSEGWQQYAPLKLATHGPVFRYERPQKGRYRQFHQLDAEIIGTDAPAADVELLVLADQFLRDLGIADGITLQLNTLGDAESRGRWRRDLLKHFGAHETYLSEDSRDRLSRNPLRILDSKNVEDQKIAQMAPEIDRYLSDEAHEFFAKVTAGLDAAGVKWTRNSRLVRGLDYYRHTAFEFVTERLGAQGTVLAGGRYDGLMESLGGSYTPAIGWAAGIERLAMMIEPPKAEKPEIVLIPRGEDADKLAFEILRLLRAGGIAAEMAYGGSAKSRFEKAKKALVPRLLDVEPVEGQIGTVLIRDINVGLGDAEPVRGRLKEALSTRFEIADPEPDFPRPIQLIRRK